MCWEPAMDKAEALKMLETAGIEPPLLTRLGFPHANCGGGCVKAGIKQFKKLLEVAPETYAWWEWNEERMRALLGRDVALLTDRSGGRSGADRRPMSLRELRERTATRTAVFTDEDWGACNCLMSEEATLNDRNAEAPIGAGASHPSTEASGGAPQQYSEPREILGFFVGEDTVISTIPERASMSDEAEREE